MRLISFKFYGEISMYKYLLSTLILLLLGCTHIEGDEMLADGSFVAKTLGSVGRSQKELRKGALNIAKSNCPDGFKVLSMSYFSKGIYPGAKLRYRCNGTKAFGEEDKKSKETTMNKKEQFKKAKKCQKKGGIWMDGSCHLSLD